MLRLLNRWRERRAHRALVEEARRDWTIIYSGKETRASDGGMVARYVCEQNALGERRVRVIWKYAPYYQLSSPRYTEWLVWVEMQEHKMPPRYEQEIRPVW